MNRHLTAATLTRPAAVLARSTGTAQGRTDLFAAPGRRTLEYFLVVATIAVVLAVTSLPYLLAQRGAPPSRQFMGIILNVPDTTQYLSWAREFGSAWLIHNQLTPEQGDAVFFNLFWLVVGRAAAVLGTPLPEALQASRLVAGALYLAAIYWLVSLFSSSALQRWTAFLVIALGGGLGWIHVAVKQWTGELSFPLDVYVMEANSFFTVLAFPHQAMAGALLVVILGMGMLAFERKSIWLAFGAGILTLLLGLQHGYDLLIVYAVIGTAGLALAWRNRPRLHPLVLSALIGLPSVPAAVYLMYVTRESPIWRGVLAQYGNAGVYTPPPLHLFILLGLPLIITCAGAIGWLLQSRGRFSTIALQVSPRELVLAIWMVLGCLLIYVPTDFQIKMLAGWNIPLGIYATRLLLTRVAPQLSRWGAKHAGVIVATGFILAVLPTNVYLVAWRLIDLHRYDAPYFLHAEEVEALRWLDANTTSTEVVLSSLTIGQYVPPVAGNRAFLAHWAQTLDFFAKRDVVSRFFADGMQDEERLRIIDEFGIDYIFYSAHERSFGSYDLDFSSFSTKIYANSEVSIFKIREQVAFLGANHGH